MKNRYTIFRQVK